MLNFLRGDILLVHFPVVERSVPTFLLALLDLLTKVVECDLVVFASFSREYPLLVVFLAN